MADSDSSTGFDASIFVTELPDECICALCLNILNDPRQCPNGHCFCKPCIRQSLNTRNLCPLCKCHLSMDKLGRNLFMQGVIEKSKTYCLSTDRVDRSSVECCQWTGTLVTRKAHYEKECGFFLSECTNENCKMLIQRRFAADHIAECVNIDCSSCHKSFLRREIVNHEATCDFRTVSCDNGCGVSLIYKDMHKHRSDDCPLQIVECPLSKQGLCTNCPRTMTRDQLSSHMAQSADLSRHALNTLIRQNNELKSQLTSITYTELKRQEMLSQYKTDFETKLQAMQASTHISMLSDVKSCDLLRKWALSGANGYEEHTMRIIENKLNITPQMIVFHLAYEAFWQDLSASLLGVLSEEVQLSTMLTVRIAIHPESAGGKFIISLVPSDLQILRGMCMRVTIFDLTSICMNQTYTSKLTSAEDKWPRVTDAHLSSLVDRRDNTVKILVTIYMASKETCLDCGY